MIYGIIYRQNCQPLSIILSHFSRSLLSTSKNRGFNQEEFWWEWETNRDFMSWGFSQPKLCFSACSCDLSWLKRVIFSNQQNVDLEWFRWIWSAKITRFNVLNQQRCGASKHVPKERPSTWQNVAHRVSMSHADQHSKHMNKIIRSWLYAPGFCIHLIVSDPLAGWPSCNMRVTKQSAGHGAMKHGGRVASQGVRPGTKISQDGIN